jgi:hypothetical protein
MAESGTPLSVVLAYLQKASVVHTVNDLLHPHWTVEVLLVDMNEFWRLPIDARPVTVV